MIGEKMFIAPTESDAYIFPKSDIAFAVTPVPIPTFDTIVVKVTLVIFAVVPSSSPKGTVADPIDVDWFTHPIFDLK